MFYLKENANPSKRVGMDGVFPWAGRAAPRALPLGNPSEQPYQSLENPVHPSSFTWINPVCGQVKLIITTFVSL